MGTVINLTPFAAGEATWTDPAGQPQLLVAVKATYTWTTDGVTSLIDPEPLHGLDEFVGDPASSGLVRCSDLCPPKPRVDVSLVGAFTFPAPMRQIDVVLEVGKRLRKTARVFGERVWVPGIVRDQVPCAPTPIARVPIEWERASGGLDSSDPRRTEMRNPAGIGVIGRPRDLEGKPVPNFEHPEHPLKSCNDRPPPMGFGPVAAHWEPRRSRAGTYDDEWKATRRPRLPEDFDPLYWNVAPEDQQLDGYRPGETVRLVSMTATGQDSFQLPELRVPVIFSTRDELHEAIALVDTIIIAPEQRLFSLVAHAAHSPSGGMPLRQVIVGQASKGRLRALERGKHYLDLRSHSR